MLDPKNLQNNFLSPQFADKLKIHPIKKYKNDIKKKKKSHRSIIYTNLDIYGSIEAIGSSTRPRIACTAISSLKSPQVFPQRLPIIGL